MCSSDLYIADIHNSRTNFIPNDYYVQTIAIKNANKLFPDFKTKVGNVFYNPSKAAFVLNKESVTLQEKINQVLEEMRKDGLARLEEVIARIPTWRWPDLVGISAAELARARVRCDGQKVELLVPLVRAAVAWHSVDRKSVV